MLRRDRRAVEKFGAAAGVVLTGIGGIGKTALAGRVMARLADEGWLVAVHEGRWSPAALIASTARAAASAVGTSADPGGMLGAAAGTLADPGLDDVPKLAVIGQLLGSARLLVVLDDFEQNLTVGGDAFLDPAAAEALTTLAAAADPGHCWSPAGTRCQARTASWSRYRSHRCHRPSCAGCSCDCPRCATWTESSGGC